MKRRKKVPAAALLLLCLLISLVSAAGAADASPQVDMNKIDPSKIGSLTITMKCGGEIVPGGSLNVYQVATVDNSGEQVAWTFTEAFAGFGGSLGDLNNEALPGMLLDYADKNNVSWTKMEIGTDGKGTVGNLTPGLYLIAQDVPATNYTDIMPFLLMIPTLEDGQLVYDVKAYPKVEPDETDHPNKPYTPPDEPDEPGDSDKPDPGGKLPQTGQLWWPVPVLAGAGLLMLAFGWSSWRRARNEED